MAARNAPATEDLRLLALYREEILDTEADAAFDALTNAAALVCETPICLISLVDDKRQWFKSAVGLDQGAETPREQAFCAHAIQEPSVIFEVPNALQDPRFADNPLVTDDPGIRFYAGMPVKSIEGHPLGTLCVIDRVPRVLSENQRDALRKIADGVETLIRNRRRQKDSARRLSQVYIETPALLYLLDSTGAFIEVSNLWLERFGYKRAEILGRNARELMSKKARREFLGVRDELWAAGGCHDHPSQFVTADGTTVDVLMSAAIEKDDKGLPIRVRCVLTDVTRQLQLQRELEERSRTDEMTDILNRGWFRERLRNELDRAARYGRKISLLLFDLDSFKLLNDSYGHAAGDQALVVIANQTRKNLRDCDELGRVGGEEFAIMLPETSVEQAMQVAERLRQHVESLDLAQHDLCSSLTISLGVSTNETAQSIDELFEQADAAMYAAKHAGRNRVVAWRPSMAHSKLPVHTPKSAAKSGTTQPDANHHDNDVAVPSA